MMVKGAELIPYNVDSILGTPECIITEGEFDAAAIIAAGDVYKRQRFGNARSSR